MEILKCQLCDWTQAENESCSLFPEELCSRCNKRVCLCCTAIDLDVVCKKCAKKTCLECGVYTERVCGVCQKIRFCEQCGGNEAVELMNCEYCANLFCFDPYGCEKKCLCQCPSLDLPVDPPNSLALKHNLEKTVFEITSTLTIREEKNSFDLLIPIASEWRSIVEMLNRNYLHEKLGNLNINYDPDYIRVGVAEKHLKEFFRKDEQGQRYKLKIVAYPINMSVDYYLLTD